MNKIVVATKNKGKAAEIKRLLEPAGVQVLSMLDFAILELPPETGTTFAANATAKARFVAEALQCECLADDSGLEVDYLLGAPGVYSARYAGEGATDEDNWRKLLAELSGVPPGKRTARFVCVVAFTKPDKSDATVHTFDGALEGTIAEAPSGPNGFGYDPVFYIPSLQKTVAQLSLDEKNMISHRGQALKKFKAWFEDCL
ncbi:MAG: XTP/dITP diphosphatase [Deltaproteobacteria bacterium]|nr:XTP/dITP diphosphatase [Deltaproteobacteria bacterium]